MGGRRLSHPSLTRLPERGSQPDDFTSPLSGVPIQRVWPPPPTRRARYAPRPASPANTHTRGRSPYHTARATGTLHAYVRGLRVASVDNERALQHGRVSGLSTAFDSPTPLR